MENYTEFSTEHFGFTATDYIICGSTICVCICIGVYYAYIGGKAQSTTDYLLGNRRLQMMPVAFSLVVSFESSIFMLGFPAETYVYGVFLIWDILATCLAMILVGARIAAPLFHPLRITSVYEYMELRFKSSGPRILCTLIGMLYFLFYMGIVLYGPALAIEAVMQFPLSWSIVLVAAVAMIYTALGGIKAVVWTDVIQCLIMTIGMIAILYQCAKDSGGFKSIWLRNKQYRRLDVIDLRVNPTIRHTTWSMLLGSFVRAISVVFNQSSIQRISTVSTQREAKIIFYISGCLFLVLGVLINLEGLATFAYFNAIKCDPLEAGIISNPNQIVPFMVTRIFHHVPGMSGLFMAALFGAALSTLSSGLNSLCAQFTEDFVKPNFKSISDVQATVIAKLSVVVFGSVAIGISFMIANVQGSLLQIADSMLTSFSGPVTGMFLYAIFCPWATQQGAIIGGISSMAFVLWLSLGQNFSASLLRQPWMPHNPMENCFMNVSFTFNDNKTSVHYNDSLLYSVSRYEEKTPSLDTYDAVIADFWNSAPSGVDKLYAVSYTWFASIAVLTVFVVGSGVSLISGYAKAKDVDPRLVLPIGDVLFPFLPRRAKRLLEFGVRFDKRRQWLHTLRCDTDNNVSGNVQEENIILS